MKEIKPIQYVKDFKALIGEFIRKQNAHKIYGIIIGASEDDDTENVLFLYLNPQLIEITYKDTTYQMSINQGNKQGIYRNLKRFICLVPMYFYTKSKKDGPYTYYRYEKKLKLIRDLIDC
jgi:hypothetical protein